MAEFKPERISLDETKIGGFDLPEVRVSIISRTGKVVLREEIKRPEGVMTLNFSLNPDNAKVLASMLEQGADLSTKYRSIARPSAAIKGN